VVPSCDVMMKGEFSRGGSVSICYTRVRTLAGRTIHPGKVHWLDARMGLIRRRCVLCAVADVVGSACDESTL
jgi:hypothetical protein